MSNFSRFNQKNKYQKANNTFDTTNYLLDENGEPLLLVVIPLFTLENDTITD